MTRLYRTRVRHPPLLVPPSRVRAMLRYKPRWVPIPDRGPRSAEWPEFSLAEWRARRRAEAAALSLARAYREPDTIRVISGWKANKRQRVLYEKGRS